MKISLSTVIDLSADDVWQEVQTSALLAHITWPIIRFQPIDPVSPPAVITEGRYLVRLWLFGFIPFGSQCIVASQHFAANDEWPKQIRDNGHGTFMKVWDHWITVQPLGGNRVDYRDAVEIEAGLISPFVWLFSQMFYRHRQRRWRGLARTLHIRRLIDEEMQAYRQSRSDNDQDAAWRSLERAHILSQPYLGFHITNHMAMLSYALHQRQWGEFAGQMLRLGLAPLGALIGKIPYGNTGRSNVSAFQPMPVPADLQAKVDRLVKTGAHF